MHDPAPALLKWINADERSDHKARDVFRRVHRDGFVGSCCAAPVQGTLEKHLRRFPQFYSRIGSSMNSDPWE